MAALYGRWLADPPLHGPQVVTVDGVVFSLPEYAVVKIVSAGKHKIAHAKIGPRVIVLSALGVLLESDAEARSRAGLHNWQSVAS